MNGPVHGLRAKRWVAVPALGEDPGTVAAHYAAVRDELGTTGPLGRDLAEAAAEATLRDARATFALLQRYRLEADGDIRRSLDAVYRLHRTRIEGFVPDGEEAQGVEAAPDAEVADLPAPSEPRSRKIVPVQQPSRPTSARAAPPRPRPAAPAPAPPAARPAYTPPRSPPEPPRVPTGTDLLRRYRWFKTERDRAWMWRTITPAQRATTLAAALAGQPGPGAAGLGPEAPCEALRPVLAGPTAIAPAPPAPT